MPSLQHHEPGDDIDTRIARVELRILEREQRLRRQAAALVERGKRAVAPARLVLPLGSALVSGLTLWWLSRGRPPQPAMPATAAGTTPTASRWGSASSAWLGLLPMVWPVLPARWRARMSPATASTLLAVGLPIVQRLIQGQPMPPPITVPHLELARYAGTWYEIARLAAPFERACGGQPTAHYMPQGDGSISVVNRCPGADGRVRESQGAAVPVPGTGGGQLRVSLWPALLRWLPLAWADYRVLHVDANYTEALVGTPGRRALWILSRTPTLPPMRLQAMVQLARDQGYAVERLHFSDQDR